MRNRYDQVGSGNNVLCVRGANVSAAVKQLAGFLLVCASLAGDALAADGLAKGFRSPPQEARPQTWWHWLDGNVTREGITADLEAMKKVGVGEAQIFNITQGMPKGPDAKYLSPEWRKLVQFAVQEADRIGIRLGMHNCAGWSSTGGPWNTPEHSMQKLVFSETPVTGPCGFSAILPQPETKLGYYRDVTVLAVPERVAETPPIAGLKPRVVVGGVEGVGAELFDGDETTGLTVPSPQSGGTETLLIAFPDPLPSRLIKINSPSCSRICTLEVSDDGVKFRTVAAFDPGYAQKGVDFAPVSTRFYRLVFRADNRNPIKINEVSLHNELRISGIAAKAGYGIATQFTPTSSAGMTEGSILKTTEMIDLSAKMAADGRLSWQVPSGRWTIIRFGHTSTGSSNEPAPHEGVGLETDKFSQEALDIHWEHGVKPILDDMKAVAGRSLKTLLIDSYERGPQNWTAKFPAEFKRLRGYEIKPYLPVFTGRIVGSVAESERFLWDVRRTIADLFAENYARYTELCHQNNLLSAIEPYTATEAAGPYESMLCGKTIDIPMGEFWAFDGSGTSCKLAASIAHVYGRKFAATESFTSFPKNSAWSNDPQQFKIQGDLNFCNGINRLIFHRYAHQPWLDKFPGMTMGFWGFNFERTLTWWEPGAAWLDYLARCQYLLQQGHYVADACYFQGEQAPHMLTLHPELEARGYHYDGVNADAVNTRLQVRDGRLTLPDGMSYKVMVLPESAEMTPQTLRRIGTLIKDGAVVVGPRPVQSPSLAGYPDCDGEVKSLANEIWRDCDGVKIKQRRYGKGWIFCGMSVGDVLAALEVRPDFSYRGNDKLSKISFIHRRSSDAEIYFVSNQRMVTEDLECVFRVNGKDPERWTPETGETTRVVCWRASDDGRTVIPLRLDPGEATFVIFRNKVQGAHIVSAGFTPARPTVPESRPVSLEIRKAVYQTRDIDAFVDVTEKIKALVKDGKMTVKVDATLAEDPAYVHAKQLRVDYTINGRRTTAFALNYSRMELPQAQDVFRYSPPDLELAGDAHGGMSLHAWRSGVASIKTSDGHDVTVEAKDVPQPWVVEGPWTLHFPAKWGAPETVVLDRLISWIDHPDEGVRYFSGTATYIKEFDVPAAMMGSNRRTELDLGVVKNLAEVTLNGKKLATLWRMPFTVDLSDALNSGKNRLEVKVTNLWPNRLIGDQKLPPDKRFTFATWNPYKADSDLLESGLIGPVIIRSAEILPVQFRQVTNAKPSQPQAAAFHVDPLHGDDSADGLSPEHAWKTWKRFAAEARPGSSLLLKRGCVYALPLPVVAGDAQAPVVYGAYGEGAKPLFEGNIINLSEPARWKQAGTGVWETVQSVPEAANVVFDDVACGNMRYSREELRQKGEWHQNLSGKGPLFVFAPENPAKVWKKVELIPAIISDDNGPIFLTGKETRHIRLENLCFRKFGTHAIRVQKGASDITIRSCDFRLIGGAFFRADGFSRKYGERFVQRRVRYGNAIETWADVSNITVEGCRISEIFDGGFCIQGFNGVASNIVVRNNIFWNCGYDSLDIAHGVRPDHVVFEQNTIWNGGEGWALQGEPRPRYSLNSPDQLGYLCNLENSYAWKEGAISIRKNIFCNAPESRCFNFGPKPPTGMHLIKVEDNCYFQANPKDTLVQLGSQRFTAKEFDAYRKMTGWDTHSVVGDPLFVAPAAGDFRLKAESPAQGLGSQMSLQPE